MAVKKAVQCGNVEDAIEKVNDLNPEVDILIWNLLLILWHIGFRKVYIVLIIVLFCTHLTANSFVNLKLLGFISSCAMCTLHI
jgi:hypothetical protein